VRRHPARSLDLAPQVHEGARPFFSSTIVVEISDIDPAARCTPTGDLGAPNPSLADGSLDHAVRTEVPEHTLQSLFEKSGGIGGAGWRPREKRLVGA